MISLGGIIGAGLFIEADRSLTPLDRDLFFVRICWFTRYFSHANAWRNVYCKSFQRFVFHLCKEALGPWAGYTIGWLYWFFWVIVIAVEAIAGANIIQYWFPSLPSWGVSLALTFY